MKNLSYVKLRKIDKFKEVSIESAYSHRYSLNMKKVKIKIFEMF